MGGLLGLFQRVRVDGRREGGVNRIAFGDPAREATVEDGNLLVAESLAPLSVGQRSASLIRLQSTERLTLKVNAVLGLLNTPTVSYTTT